MGSCVYVFLGENGQNQHKTNIPNIPS